MAQKVVTCLLDLQLDASLSLHFVDLFSLFEPCMLIFQHLGLCTSASSTGQLDIQVNIYSPDATKSFP